MCKLPCRSASGIPRLVSTVLTDSSGGHPSASASSTSDSMPGISLRSRFYRTRQFQKLEGLQSEMTGNETEVPLLSVPRWKCLETKNVAISRCVHLNEMRSLVRRVALGVLSEYVRVLVFELRCSYDDFFNMLLDEGLQVARYCLHIVDVFLHALKCTLEL